MKPKTPKSEPNPIDATVGDAKDVEQTALTMGSREIQAAAISEEPLAERRDRLQRMRQELVSRMGTGKGEDLKPLLEEIDRAIAHLSGPDAL
jgi:hypothetical protein